MGRGIKVALPGYDAYTDTDPGHFALYVDQGEANEQTLIKVKESDRVLVGATSSQNVAHGFGYVPFCLVFVEVSSGVWRKVFGTPIDGTDYYFTVDATNLTIHNDSASPLNYAYHIFYDNITS